MSKKQELNIYLYNSNITKINIEYIFVDISKNIENVVNETIVLEKNNILEKDHLIKVLKKHLKFNNKIYTPSCILKYNIDIKSENIKQFIKYPIDFLTVVKEIKDIEWEKCCKYLNSLNKLYLILNEQTPNIKKIKFIKTKKNKPKNIKNKKTRKKKIKIKIKGKLKENKN